MTDPNELNPVVLFGETIFRQCEQQFGIKMDDRRRHMYVIGKSGMGKSELLKNIAIQDIRSGRGLAFVDPHGDPVEELLDYIPPERVKDVIYINPADLDYPVGFNVMENVAADKRHLIADGVMAVFKKLWVDLWSARMEYILNYTILALLEAPDSTIIGINRMLSDKAYRKWVVDHISDPEVRAFWTKEYASYTDKYTAEATPAIQNKIGQFVSNSLIRNMIGQPKSSFDIRQAMDEGKILLLNISKGRVGEDASRLLGGLFITKIQLAAMSRVDIPKHERKDFVLIVDEFQNFATASFANILSEARKFNLSLLVAHQYVAQMDEMVRDAVFGNVGTIVSFRVGAEDAELLEKEFSPEFMVEDLVSLPKYHIALKLMVDGITSNAFSARAMAPLPMPTPNTRDQVIHMSREQYGRPREATEKIIAEWRAKDFEPPRPERPAEGGPDRGPREGPPRDDQRHHSRRQHSPSAPQAQPNPRSGMSLNQAFQKPPVDFRGHPERRPAPPKPPEATKAVAEASIGESSTLDELRRFLRETLKRDDPDQDKTTDEDHIEKA